MEYSIVIVAYKSEKVIIECLKSLINTISFPDLELEIIVVDNDAYGCWGSIELIKSELNNSRIKLIKAEHNLGFSGGCNLGVKSSSGKWLLFLNPDAFVNKDFFCILSHDLRYMESNFDKSYPWVIGFMMVGTDGKPNRNGGILPEIYSFKLNWKKYIYPPGYFLKVSNHSIDGLVWPLGAAMMVPRRVFIDLEGFDEKIFLTLEEPSFLNKLKKYILFFSRASVIHEGGHSYESSLEEIRFYCKSLEVYRDSYKFNYMKRLKLALIAYKLKVKLYFLERSAND